jgi:hypothetical protein
MVSGMTDVMSHGVYPHDPLPGPRQKTREEVFRAWNEAMEPIRPVDYGFYRRYTETHGPPNPILEPPAYFPGATWKHTWVHA